MLWLNFLHLYQPANLDTYFIKEAADKSYLRLLRLLEENPNVRFTFNISACLLERLVDAGYHDFLRRFKILVQRGQVELLGSAAYHAFLPLIPETEVRAQIKEQESLIKKHFGPVKLRGFFSPEMAYSKELARIVKSLGYDWMVLDGISWHTKARQKHDCNRPYIDKASGLKIIFRNRQLSNAYVPKEIKRLLKEGKEQVVITATDGELYGLRHEDPRAELENIVSHKDLQTKTYSEFINSFSVDSLKKIDLRSSTWESDERELKLRRPFWLWHAPKNKIHNYSWRLAELAMSLEQKFKKDKNYQSCRWHLVRGLASCTFWWASGRSLAHNFGPTAWSPDEVERGLNDLIRSIRSLQDPATKKDKIKGEKLYLKAKGQLWRRHWEKYF